jgi:hypothetical protein
MMTNTTKSWPIQAYHGSSWLLENKERADSTNFGNTIKTLAEFHDL